MLLTTWKDNLFSRCIQLVHLKCLFLTAKLLPQHGYFSKNSPGFPQTKHLWFHQNLSDFDLVFSSLINKETRMPPETVKFFTLKQRSKKYWGEIVLGTCQRLFRGILTKSSKSGDFSKLDVIWSNARAHCLLEI